MIINQNILTILRKFSSLQKKKKKKIERLYNKETTSKTATTEFRS